MEQAVLRRRGGPVPDHRLRSRLLPPDLPPGRSAGTGRPRAGTLAPGVRRSSRCLFALGRDAPGACCWPDPRWDRGAEGIGHGVLRGFGPGAAGFPQAIPLGRGVGPAGSVPGIHSDSGSMEAGREAPLRQSCAGCRWVLGSSALRWGAWCGKSPSSTVRCFKACLNKGPQTPLNMGASKPTEGEAEAEGPIPCSQWGLGVVGKSLSSPGRGARGTGLWVP